MTRTRLQAHVRYQIERHGWLAAGALAVLLLALLLQWGWVATLEADNTALTAEVAAQRRQLTQKPLAQEDSAQRQAHSYAALPDTEAALEAFDVLNSAAARQRLAVSTAEYRITTSGTGPLLRYQISLPLRGDYVALHAWLSDVLNALPHAALDDISLKREDAGQPLLDARVRLTVFMRGR
jgi:hypothetical protein